MALRLVALLIALALASGCDQPRPTGGVSTHVEDWRDQIIYQVLVDRFDNAEPSNDTIGTIGPDPDDLSRFQGGDWAGVRRRLDYIEHLGMTTIWISPPYRNVERTETEDGYHGYWPADFTEANPRFGSIEDLRALVDDAHARGMLVILDVVPNHAGRVFNYDLDSSGTVEPGEIEPAFAPDAYDVPLIFDERPRLWLDGVPMELGPEHFHRRGFGSLGDDTQRELGDFPTGLRDLDTENEDVIRGLIETHVRWVEDTDVDGFRIDAVPHVPEVFWQRFSRGLREALAEIGKERFLLLGEVFDPNPERLARYTNLDQLDSVFAFDLKVELINGVLLEGGPPSAALGSLGANRSAFPASAQPLGVGLDPWQARVGFADNHDVWRLRGELDDPLAAAIALTVIFTVDAIPSVYYGTEQDLDGRQHHASRERLWDVGFDEDGATFRLIAELSAIRRRSRALRRGSLTVRFASDTGGADPAPTPDAGMLAYERLDGDERVLVVINSAVQDSTASFAAGFAPGELLYDALGGTDAPWNVASDGTISISLPGRAAVVLEAR